MWLIISFIWWHWPVPLHLDVNRRHLYVAYNDFRDGKWKAGQVVVSSMTTLRIAVPSCNTGRMNSHLSSWLSAEFKLLSVLWLGLLPALICAGCPDFQPKCSASRVPATVTHSSGRRRLVSWFIGIGSNLNLWKKGFGLDLENMQYSTLLRKKMNNEQWQIHRQIHFLKIIFRKDRTWHNMLKEHVGS